MAHTTRRVLIIAVGLAVAAAAVAVLLLLPGRQSPDRLVLYGNVDIRQVELAFNARDRIVKMLAVEGQTVEAGELLAVLDRRSLELAVREAEAKAVVKAQVLARLEAGSRPEEIRRARADVAAARAELADTKALYQRVQETHRQGAATAQELDNAQSAYRVAEARLKSASQQLALVLAGPRQEKIAAARADLKAAEAALARLRKDLSDTLLCAPADGTIQQRILEPGDMAAPERPVYTLAVTDPVWVRGYVSETDLGKIWPGMAVTVTTDSFPDKRYDGWIGYISPTAEFTPKTVQTEDLRTSLVYQVRVYVRSPDNELRLGMPATMTIDLTQSRASASRPAAAATSVPASTRPAGTSRGGLR